MAIIKQEMESLHDEKDSTRIKTTVSLDEAIEEVQKANITGGRIGRGSDEMVIMFKVPQELWVLDPLLKKADWFRRHGDMGQFTKYIKQWKKLNPKLCVEYQRRVFATR